MQYPALVNRFRCRSSDLSDGEVQALPETINSLSRPKLNAVATVLGVDVDRGSAKNVLLIKLKSQLDELLLQPLSYKALRQEAELRDIPHLDFSYRDLRVLLGYETITSAGRIYYDCQVHDQLSATLRSTVPGSWRRLFRLKQLSHSDWLVDAPVRSNEPVLYRYLFTQAVKTTTSSDQRVIILDSDEDDIGSILIHTLPTSTDRRRLLCDYDPGLLQEFKVTQQLPPDYDLSTAVALTSSSYVSVVEVEMEATRYYVDDNCGLNRLLAQFEPLTLQRYVACLAFGGDVVHWCQQPRLLDQRPTQIRDYHPDELAELPLPVLQSYAVKEGVLLDNDRERYTRSALLEELHVAYVSPTFLRTDSIERTEQTQTCLLTDLTEVPLLQRYAFGLRDGTGTYRYYERDELQNKFSAERAFMDPLTNAAFSLTAIRRLVVLSQQDTTASGVAFTTDLQQLIKDTVVYDQTELQLVRELQAVPAAETALIKLLEAGLYMRRWDGNLLRYPLHESATLQVVDDELLFTRINNALDALRDSVDALDADKRELFWSLRLKSYSHSGYYSATEAVDGYTVRDRYRIVRLGDSRDAPITSCVRLTSKWFICTALYYYQLLYQKALYGIRPQLVDNIA